MRIALVVAVFRRLDLERITIDRFRRQAEKFGFEIIIAGSEGEISKNLAHGCHYVEVPNKPVSNKHNAMLEKAKELDIDGIVVMGSDDLVNDAYWSWLYTIANRSESHIVGLTDAYFFHTTTNELYYWAGYRNSTQTVGAGRFYSRLILEKFNWKLWREGINRGLDSSVNAKWPYEKSYTMEQSGAFLVDIKHIRNITPPAIIDLCLKSEGSILVEEIGTEDSNKLFDLQNNINKPPGEDGRTFTPGQIVTFESNGNFKPLEQFTDMTIEQAQILHNKGFGTY